MLSLNDGDNGQILVPNDGEKEEDDENDDDYDPTCPVQPVVKQHVSFADKLLEVAEPPQAPLPPESDEALFTAVLPFLGASQAPLPLDSDEEFADALQELQIDEAQPTPIVDVSTINQFLTAQLVSIGELQYKLAAAPRMAMTPTEMFELSIKVDTLKRAVEEAGELILETFDSAETLG